MTSRPSLAVVATLAFVLSACATASVQERTAACQATDWTGYGQNDGILGVAPNARDKKFSDCAELGYPADTVAYQAGRAQGLLQYCTLENGYQVGIEGLRYRKACPPGLEAAFLQGYEQGRKDRPITIRPSIGFGFGFGHFYNGNHFGFSRFGRRSHYHGHRSHRTSGRWGTER